MIISLTRWLGGGVIVSLDAGEVTHSPWCYGPQAFSIGRRPLLHRDDGDWRTSLSSPTWWLNSRVEVLQTVHCSGASTKHLTLVTDQQIQSGLPQGVTLQLNEVLMVTFKAD